MAIVVEKPPFVGTTGQCLILNPRERLIYPFSFGNYSEIRCAIAWSLTAATGNNSTLNASDVYAQTAPPNSIYFGFCNFQTGSLLPGQSGGYDYVGTIPGGPNTAGINAGGGNLNWQGGGSSATNCRIGVTDITGGRFTGAPNELNIAASVSQTNIAGATSFAGLLGWKFTLSGSNAYSLQGLTTDTSFTSNVSTSNLRTFIASPSTTTSVVTGFFTSGGTAAGNRLMVPNAFFVYMPMLNQRLRIHNLVVERYA